MTKSDKTPTQYTATFSLTQTGMDGDVHSKLTFNPLVQNQDPNAPAPLAFEQMSWLVQEYLYNIGMIDEQGNLIGSAGDDHVLEVSTFGSGTLN